MIEQFRDRLEDELFRYDSQIEKYGKIRFDRNGARIASSAAGLPRRRSYENYIETIRNIVDGTEQAPEADMLRPDGTTKSNTGYLGQIQNNVQGGVMTEVSVSFDEVNDGKIIPLLVPTLTYKEITQLQDMQIEGNAKNIPQSIKDKAIAHAKMRLSKGLNPFYQDGEEEE